MLEQMARIPVIKGKKTKKPKSRSPYALEALSLPSAGPHQDKRKSKKSKQKAKKLQAKEASEDSDET